MIISRKKFILIFILCGFAFLGITTSILGTTGPRGFPKPPDSILKTGENSQIPWKRTASSILVPVKIILVGPLLIPSVNFLKDDPPPPFVGIYFIFYWTILATVIYSLLNKFNQK